MWCYVIIMCHASINDINTYSMCDVNSTFSRRSKCASSCHRWSIPSSLAQAISVYSPAALWLLIYNYYIYNHIIIWCLFMLFMLQKLHEKMRSHPWQSSTSMGTSHLTGSRHEELTLQLELAEELGSAFRASSLRASGARCQERSKRQETHME